MLYTTQNRCRGKLLIAVGAAALLALSTGCADRSGTVLQADVAESTLILAEQANAEQLAPGEFSQASQTVNTAKTAVAEQDWDVAESHGKLGEAQASHALYRAKAAHTRQRLEAVTMLPVN